jgi:type I restriction enzyme S subunit
MRSSAYYNRLLGSVTGTTRKRISRKNLGNVELDVPSLSEQKSVVERLNCLVNIMCARQQELQKLDDLIKARFVEMFGTYPENPKKWKICTIRDIVSDVRYGSSRPAVDDGKYPYLRMNNITYGGELDLSDTKMIDVPDKELDKCTVRRGDVLFNRTNSKELVGKTCVYNRDEMMVLAGFVIRVRVNERILPEFLSAFLNTDFSKKMLFGMCKAAIGQANINAQEMQNIGIYLPPIEMQEQFVLFKDQVDKSKLLLIRNP